MSNIDMDSVSYKRPGFLSPCSTFTLLGFLLLLASCGQQGRGNQASTSSLVKADNRPATSEVAGAFSSLHMIDAMIGWAVSWNIGETSSYSILKTSDGGRHWKSMLQCLPTQSLGRGFVAGCSTDFHSASVATVVQPEYDSKSQASRLRIFHTGDGGQTWQSSLINARDLQTPAVFVDDLHGWVFATDHFPGPDPGSAYIGGQIVLYRPRWRKNLAENCQRPIHIANSFNKRRCIRNTSPGRQRSHAICDANNRVAHRLGSAPGQVELFLAVRHTQRW